MSGPYKYHDQPEHLEHVLNDINDELWSTRHGLSYGATSMLRFLATITWTSKKDHPERYGTINPKYARCKAMAQMTGASESSVKRYLAELEKAGFIRREHQYGADGFRKEDRIWIRWGDADRKARSNDVSDLMALFCADTDEPTAKPYDNRYWVAPSGQFWRYDNKDRKRDDREKLVTLTSEESLFFWDKKSGLDTSQRRRIMRRLRDDPGAHAWLYATIRKYNAHRNRGAA